MIHNHELYDMSEYKKEHPIYKFAEEYCEKNNLVLE